MISPLRSIFINDDETSFTCVFPTQYHIMSISPFDILRTENLNGITVGAAATCCGYRFIGLTGLPADPHFDSRCIVIREHSDTPKEVFRKTFDQHILSFRVTESSVICAFFDHIEVWDYQSNTCIHHAKSAINVHAPLDVSKDGRFVAFSGNNALDLCLLSMKSKKMTQFHAADNPVSLVTFSRSPGYFASTSSAGHTIKVWRNETQQCMIKCKRGNMASVIHSIDFSPNNEFLAVLSQNGTLHFFDIRRGSSGSSAPTVRSFHRMSVGECSVAYLSWFSSYQIAVITMEGMLTIISIDEQTCHEVGREQTQFLHRLLEESSIM